MRPLVVTALAAAAIGLAGCVPEDAAPGTPPTETPFFVGNWAASVEMCNAPWRITATTLTTPGEVACSFGSVTPTAIGYTAEATCTAEAPPAPHTLQFSYAQSAQALLIEGGPFEPIGLVRCP